MQAPLLTAAEAHPLLAADHPPPGLRVRGALDYSAESEREPPARFPDMLTADVLNLSGRDLTELPTGLCCYELNLARTGLRVVPADLRVETRLDLTGCDRLERLPEGLTTGTLIVRGCTALRELPERLDVWFLDLTGCWAFERWPRTASIRGGRLQLRGCTALSALPPYLHRLAALDVRDCPNLKGLPANLTVTGWLDLARIAHRPSEKRDSLCSGIRENSDPNPRPRPDFSRSQLRAGAQSGLGRSGLTDESALPPGVNRTQLRWAGVNVDRRIAFHPELIRVDEVLDERNSERRRALLDRYGYGRFLEDARADILDQDVDPGGRRQLLRVRLEGDEDLVALSCSCPSTARRYMIRVPPSTPSCHHAAAWIAGFDDPDRYRPIMET